MTVPGGCRSHVCHGYLLNSFAVRSVSPGTFPHPSVVDGFNSN